MHMRARGKRYSYNLQSTIYNRLKLNNMYHVYSIYIPLFISRRLAVRLVGFLSFISYIKDPTCLPRLEGAGGEI